MDSFVVSARYQVVRELGAGGMGVVYEALDHERGDRRVALKVLRQHDADSLMRLKREFRALADVRHPNLVGLYDLVADGDTWFFTLELIEGVDFISALRPAQSTPDAPTAELALTVRTPARPGPVDLERLRALFRQLAEGVSYLHSIGRLHRDLKPSNVLVTPQGRVVILDFGLVAELGGATSISEAQGAAIVGTAPFMAPEQAGSGQLGPAADWYAVGVMLFQALTGRVPFDGPAVQVLLDKQRQSAPPLDASLPGEWQQLCAALLERDPALRATASQVLAQLGVATHATARRDPDFVGRTAELAALTSLVEASRTGPRVARVVGDSGIGKSALLRRFSQLQADAGAVVLAGRCHERETVPYKALDSVMDALARHLATQPHDRVDAVLPRDAAALARMFPVLNRVPAFRSAPVRDVREPTELRRRAVHGLRELFARMADRRPVIVMVDDSQWGDLDSTLVLSELLRGEDPPCVLVLIASRIALAPLPLGAQALELVLEPLRPDEAAVLARSALGDAGRADAVARDSGGNPFLLQQLAESNGEVPLEALVTTRLDALPATAKRLLEVVCLAAGPVPEQVVTVVAGLEAHDVDTLAWLKAARLVRGGDERVEAWHDRIRVAVVRGLHPERVRDVHARLAVALRTRGDVDIDLLAWHLGAAGLRDQATDATLDAARRATSQLAFDRAALLLRRALELMQPSDLRRRAVQVDLGDQLADAGLGREAADAYVAALAEGTGPASQAIDLRRRAAEQLLRAGHVDDGLEAMRQVLAELGLSLARTPRTALISLGFRRAQLALRGLGYAEHSEAQVSADTLQRIDACWSVSMGLAMVDTVRGASFQSHQLLLALGAGEPFRVARALAAEAAFVATEGVRGERRSQQLIEQARALAVRVGDPRLLGLVDFCHGLTRFLVGRWREASQLTVKAEDQFTSQGFSVSWEAANSRLFAVWSLFYLGDLRALSVRIPALVAEAERRGDRYASTSLQSGLANVSLLVRDDPTGARQAVHRVMKAWSAREFHFQHYWAVLSEAMIDLYEGTPTPSLTRLEAAWPKLRSTMMLRIQNVRVEATFLRARLLLAQGRAEQALEVAFELDAEAVAWARAFALLVRGLAGGQAGLLRQALDVFVAQDMALFAAVTRLRLGELLRDEAQVREATAWLEGQGVQRPQAFAAMLAPVSRAVVRSA